MKYTAEAFDEWWFTTQFDRVYWQVNSQKHQTEYKWAKLAWDAARRDLLAEVERLRENIERLQVQLAGCGDAAMCNTAQSRGQQKCAEGDYGWSQSSYQDAVNAVGREIALRDQLQAAQELAATHLADQDYLCAKERKRVALECAEIAANHQPQEFADGCGTGKFIARTIRERYGVEE